MDTVAHWHETMERRDPAALQELIADECVFYSPIVHTPQEGKAITIMYLTAAMEVLGGEGFRYVRELRDGNQAVLEFIGEREGIQINGIDMFTWNDEGKIDSFKVMVRPLKAINLLHQRMMEMLEQMAATAQAQ